MRTYTAFFAGIGTVVVAIGAGLGGGLLLGDIMSPQQPKHQSSELTRLEQRHSQAPISAMNTASQPVPYLASPLASAAIAEPHLNHSSISRSQQNSTQPADRSSRPRRLRNAATSRRHHEQATRERTAPEDAYAKARDTDVKREARRGDDRRKAERRQQWAERKKVTSAPRR